MFLPRMTVECHMSPAKMHDFLGLFKIRLGDHWDCMGFDLNSYEGFER